MEYEHLIKDKDAGEESICTKLLQCSISKNLHLSWDHTIISTKSKTWRFVWRQAYSRFAGTRYRILFVSRFWFFWIWVSWTIWTSLLIFTTKDQSFLWPMPYGCIAFLAQWHVYMITDNLLTSRILVTRDI